MGTTVKTEIHGVLATIWLEGTEQRNALSQSTWEAIPPAIAEAEAAAGCRAIVLRGRGGHFGAGANIKEFGTVFASRTATLAYFESMEAAMRSVERADKPTVAVVEGVCVGASVALALACEIRLAAPTSSFAITPARLGIVYPYGDIARVVDAIGPRRAKTLIYTGRPISADTALAFGLVDSVLDGEFEPGVAGFVEAIASSSPWTIATTRRAIADVRSGVPPAKAGFPQTLFDAVNGQDFAEGLQAFLQSRPPRFRDAS